MKHLIATTALALVLSVPAVGYGQTAAPAASPAATSQTTDTRDLLSARGQHDLLATDLIGHDVYARRAVDDRTTSAERATSRDRAAPRSEARRQDGTATPGRAAASAADARTAVPITSAELDAMENIGQINDMVLSRDGKVRAIVIGIGGFLGVGQQDLAVTMDQVTFKADPEDPAKLYIVANAGVNDLERAPRFDRQMIMGSGNGAMRTGSRDIAMQTGSSSTAVRQPFSSPMVERDGYSRTDMSDVSVDRLLGKTVYSINDDSVGTVDDVKVDADGKIQDVIIDFGGFLGIGTSQVAVGFEELTILSTDGYADMRVYVDASKEQVQDRPQYKASN